ncbi:MAG: hypothetical protein BGO70_11685 [Bacteroidetes bacterium 43-93]|nr:nitroreductase family protein [Bacteroidota bacterium]OJW98125.1 MAG: hypothetical protein BGO70_11685 [Bacteroidetes bacterium 43-93]
MKEKNINGYIFQLYKKDTYDTPQVIKKSADFLRFMEKRRSVTGFSDKYVPREVIENLVLTASTAPSGGHKQPWTFCAVSNNDIKLGIRLEAEKAEKEIHQDPGAEVWLKEMYPLQPIADKSFLETAPWLIVVSKQKGLPQEIFHVTESLGIASGMLLTAIHNAGLVAMTHGISSPQTIKAMLGRPANEEPFLVIAVGYPGEECYVPKLIRKGLKDIAVFYE